MKSLLCAVTISAAIALSAPAFAKDVVVPTQSAAGFIIPKNSYLPAGTLHIDTWLPAAPDALENAYDAQNYFATRALAGTERFKIAEADNVNVLDNGAMAARFSDALGGVLTKENTPLLFKMFDRMAADSFNSLAPLKKQLKDGGRRRPFVDYPSAQVCKGAEYLKENGSYPSGHAFFGWMWANVLAEIAPERSDALFKRGLEFGDSRVVCGFHYPSDVQAGRLTANQLMTRLHTDKTFRKDFVPACKQAARALKISTAGCPR